MNKIEKMSYMHEVPNQDMKTLSGFSLPKDGKIAKLERNINKLQERIVVLEKFATEVCRSLES